MNQTAAQCPAAISFSAASRLIEAGSSTMRCRGASGSGTGIADSSARVYGCCGAANSDAVGPISTIFPRYITATRLQMCSHQPQIVRDEEIRQLQLLLQVHQQVDDLRLHRDVERRDRLVEDEERRVQRERARQADALPLAAAELVRIALEVRRVEADEPEQLGDARAARGAGRRAVDDERLLDDLRARASAG